MSTRTWVIITTILVVLSTIARAEISSHSAGASDLSPKARAEAPNAPFPGVVRLVSFNPTTKDLSRCSATVINQCLLTAAHCLDNPAQSARMAISTTGVATRLDGSSLRMLWSSGNKSEADDIALIKLEKALASPYDTSILATERAGILDAKRLKEMEDKDVSEVGTRGTIVGFGSRTTQRVGTMTLIGEGSLMLGQDSLNTAFSVPGPDTLEEGDSGGPLFIRDRSGRQVLYGVAGAVGEVGGIHALVAHHRQWITDNLSEMGCGDTGVRR